MGTSMDIENVQFNLIKFEPFQADLWSKLNLLKNFLNCKKWGKYGKDNQFLPEPSKTFPTWN